MKHLKRTLARRLYILKKYGDYNQFDNYLSGMIDMCHITRNYIYFDYLLSVRHGALLCYIGNGSKIWRGDK